MRFRRSDPTSSRGFLTRLARDTRGNALAIMAAMLIPLAAFSGSAIDAARLYTVKTRLQQACDAGVLAGRRGMTMAGSDTVLDTSDTGPAKTFFNNNFHGGWFKTTGVSFVPMLDGSNTHVTGTANATVPMTLMAMFGQPQRTITVSCEAQYDVADADIMFVLDTTGSMACTTSMNTSSCNNWASSASNINSDGNGNYYITEKTGGDAASKSRIQNLREAVASFYTTLTSLQKDPNVHFRFGFVPYSSTVNMGLDSNGGLLPRSTLAAANWTYQTRDIASENTPIGSASTQTYSGDSQSTCTGRAGKVYSTNNSTSGATYSGSSPAYTVKVSTPTYTAANGNRSSSCAVSTQTYAVTFQYYAKSVPVSSYISTYGTANTVPNPSTIDGDTDRTSRWNGCIEERSTSVTLSPSGSLPDLNVDDQPDSNDPWGPMWSDIVYAHKASSASETDTLYRTPVTRFISGYKLEYADKLNELSCPRLAQTLKTMTLSDIQNYLSASNGFRAYGTTYHDVGMTWGTRLLSPKGMFKPTPIAWPGHNPPNRYLIFLTDGLMETDINTYASHGIEQWDKRVSGGNFNGSNVDNYHSARFAAACKLARDNNHQIKIYLIAYASSITSLSSEMQNCANKSYVATDTAALNAAFSDIAQQVAMLRLAK